MNRLAGFAITTVLAMLQGCAGSLAVPQGKSAFNPVPIRPRQDIGTVESGPMKVTPVAHVAEIPIEENAPAMPGHPVTSVVVTQCNLIVAVYMTMPDGRLLRFDHNASIPSEQLITMAYSATRSERVEVSCNDAGVEGYEKHEPV